MKKIESLTPAQIARFPEFVNKWTKIGLCTAPANRTEAEKGILLAYTLAGLTTVPKIVWCGSPLSQGLTRAIVIGLKNPTVKVGKNVWASVWASVRDSVGASVRDSVGDSVWDSVGDSVWASVGASVGASVWASVRDSVGDSVGDSVWASVYGQHDANWLAFYDYFSEVCGLGQQTQKLFGLWTVARNANWFLPHERICWISERHNILNKNSEGRLHCDGAAALSYPDGWSIYALNGVRMKSEYVLTPAAKIKPETILAESNVDVRRELLRKVGIERMLSQLQHKRLDKRDDYELLSVKLSDELTDARYLKMINPSIKCFHLEGVPIECNTIEKALNWRNNNWFTNAEVLT